MSEKYDFELEECIKFCGEEMTGEHVKKLNAELATLRAAQAENERLKGSLAKLTADSEKLCARLERMQPVYDLNEAKAEALDWIMCTYDANVVMGSTDEIMREDLVTAIVTCKSKLAPARGEGKEDA